MDAVVKAFHIDPKHAIKIRFGRVLRIADMRNARVIYQNVDAIMPKNFGEPSNDVGLIPHIAGVGRSAPTRAGDFCCYRFSILRADINNMNRCAIGCELMRDRPANSAAAAGDDGSFPVQPKLACVSIFAGQRETPRFQGMKSS